MENDRSNLTGGLTPMLQIGDSRSAEAIGFHVAAFGATEVARQQADNDRGLMHALLHVNSASLMLHDKFPEYVGAADVDGGPPRGLTINLQVDDATPGSTAPLRRARRR